MMTADPDRDAGTGRAGEQARGGLSELLGLLDLEGIDTDLFRSRAAGVPGHRLFGGQVTGQALVAAERTAGGGAAGTFAARLLPAAGRHRQTGGLPGGPASGWAQLRPPAGDRRPGGPADPLPGGVVHDRRGRRRASGHRDPGPGSGLVPADGVAAPGDGVPAGQGVRPARRHPGRREGTALLRRPVVPDPRAMGRRLGRRPGQPGGGAHLHQQPDLHLGHPAASLRPPGHAAG